MIATNCNNGIFGGLDGANNAFLNGIGEGNDFVSSLKLFRSWEHCGKNVLLKLTVLEAVYFTVFFAADLVW